MKMSKFGIKNALFCHFWTGTSKNYCHIWNQHAQICLFAKFQEKTKSKFGPKCLNFGPKCLTWVFLTKNALFGYLWSRIWKNYCRIWNQHPQICLFAKFHEKTKMPKFGYFWTGIWKQSCHIWNQHPRICLITNFRGKTKMHKF